MSSNDPAVYLALFVSTCCFSDVSLRLLVLHLFFLVLFLSFVILISPSTLLHVLFTRLSLPLSPYLFLVWSAFRRTLDARDLRLLIYSLQCVSTAKTRLYLFSLMWTFVYSLATVRRFVRRLPVILFSSALSSSFVFLLLLICFFLLPSQAVSVTLPTYELLIFPPGFSCSSSFAFAAS